MVLRRSCPCLQSIDYIGGLAHAAHVVEYVLTRKGGKRGASTVLT